MSSTRVAFAMCGSYCTFSSAIPQMQLLKDKGYDITPIMSQNASTTDTRFGTAKEFIKQLEEISEKKLINTIKDAEPLGPKNMCDVMLIAPCTGNTLAKLCNGITDTSVTMAAKSLLRVGKPIIIALASNDALGVSAQNLGRVMNYRNIYFVPLTQDDIIKKPNSLVADFSKIPATVELALQNKQLQPIFI
ncbi:MAG: dipicolinate synthase subunit B [Acutalibacteraceae bacterium]|nr:dipicolinate synthase subunit B [Acutalibacteraceae bacterium]